MKFSVHFILSILVILILSDGISAQVVEHDKIRKIKTVNSEFIFLVKNNGDFTETVEKSMSKNWYLDMPYKVMTYQEFKTYNAKLNVITVDLKTEDLYRGQDALALRFKNGKDELLKVYQGEYNLDYNLTNGLSSGQHLLTQNKKYSVEKKAGRNTSKFNAKKYTDVFKNKTLLINKLEVKNRKKVGVMNESYFYKIEYNFDSEIMQKLESKDENYLVLFKSDYVRTDTNEKPYRYAHWYVFEPSSGALITFDKQEIFGVSRALLLRIKKNYIE